MHPLKPSDWKASLILVLVSTLLALATGCGGSGGGSTGSTPTPTATPANIGINIGSAVDWDDNRMFADVMKSSRTWRDTTWSNDLTALDANGWPTQDGSICVWAGIPNMQGTYALSFTGQAKVQGSWGSVSIVNQAYDAGTNQTTATLNYTSTDGSGLLLTFTNTQLTSASATGTGVTHVVLMRPKTVGGTVPTTTEVFSAPFLAALSPFAVLRTMDYAGTNQTNSSHWSDRTRPGHASQQRGNPSVPAGGYQGRGGAWEYAVLLANVTGKDLWVNVPEEADADYLTKLAQLTKYGSDGTNPYTSAQASPVWPGLAAGRKLYVEFSNEVWNTGFAQAGANHASAQAEVAAGGSPLAFDGTTNDWYWAWRRTAARIVAISTAFRGVWGDAAMMTQVRPVLMSQLGYADGPLWQAMHLMVDYYGNPAQVPVPRPPSWYVYGLGGSAYYNPSDETSVDTIFSTLGTGFEAALQADADWALPFGLKRIAYEGGPSLDATGNAATDALQAAAWADARMTQALTTQQATWDRNAGDLLVYFTLTGNYQWGFMNDVLSPGSPKMAGIAAIDAATAAPSTYGTVVPATLAASSAVIPPGWERSGTTLSQQNAWLGYPVSVPAPGTFKVALTASAATGAQAEILIDGLSIGTVTVPASGASTALATPTLAAGSHGILIRNAAGSFVLSQILVQAD